MRANEERIVKQCFERLTGCYHPETAGFMKKERDPFQNPFGHAVRAALEGVFKELIEEGRPEGFRRALQELMRIRAAQTESASEALCFVRFLREAVQEELAREAGRNGGWDGIPEEYSLLEEHLHELTVIACDLFVESRKKIDAIRIKEIRAEKERLERLMRAAEDGSREGKKRAENQRSESEKRTVRPGDCETDGR